MSTLIDFHGGLDPTLYLVYGASVVLLYVLLGSLSLRHIPTEGGSSLPLLSYVGAYHFIRDTAGVLQKGYDKYKGKVFKVALLDRWLVVINGKTLVDELQKMPDDKVSFMEAAGDFIGFAHIFGPEVLADPFHIAVVRDKLTRNLVPLFGEVYDEIEVSFGELIPAKENEWTSVPAFEAMRQAVARVSGRVFVGLPLCRNKDYLALSVDFTRDVGKARNTLLYWPRFLRPLVGKAVANVDHRIHECLRFIGPTVAERMAEMDKHGKQWHYKPNDLLQWLIDEVRARNQGPYEVARMLLVVNFAAIHTSSNSFTHALYHLAAAPEYLDPLRDEIEAVISEDGWTKTAIGKMWKLDSCLRESQRLNGINTTSLLRKTKQSITLSDGTRIPKGATIATPVLATHLDAENFDSPATFDPFRYYRQKAEDNSAVKHQFVTTAADYVSFGHGRHACPGRFFAANELKAMMAYLVLNYDFKLEDGASRPENLFAGMVITPNPKAKVLFKKRPAAS
ncbi:hypothetical protein PHLGIDRAFT_32288 [Phlebiopsis gigantea 11061_1 CR5-6]|uniref:Cytochrome P450 n=1 Tax=Phlebiopsis gigantea (strain 11061_1 CR5-6) TaxID=745531 RepID=A0A0C3S001_PHLG1|nr:hypothetical protein PHLGIDRAFT_32288 [Phlebiopsis gigantea 11061_1 CR5-6]